MSDNYDLQIIFIIYQVNEEETLKIKNQYKILVEPNVIYNLKQL